MTNLHSEDVPYPGDFTSSLHPISALCWDFYRHLHDGYLVPILSVPPGGYVLIVLFRELRTRVGSFLLVHTRVGGGWGWQAFPSILGKPKYKFPTLPWKHGCGGNRVTERSWHTNIWITKQSYRVIWGLCKCIC